MAYGEDSITMSYVPLHWDSGLNLLAVLMAWSMAQNGAGRGTVNSAYQTLDTKPAKTAG